MSKGAAISSYGCLDCTPDPNNPAPARREEHGREAEARGGARRRTPSSAATFLRRASSRCSRHITPGAGGELQLTDGIKALLQYEKVYGFSYEGKRHDAGDKLGFLKATVEFALKRDDLGPAFREWLQAFPL